MKQYFEVSGGDDATHLRVDTLYRKEGRRCYFLSVAPIKVERQVLGGVQYRTETCSAYSGFNLLLEEVQRASKKVQERLENEVEASIRDRSGRAWEVVQAVLDKNNLTLKEAA